MKDVGIERAASDIHRLIAHGLKARSPRRAEASGARLSAESMGLYVYKRHSCGLRVNFPSS